MTHPTQGIYTLANDAVIEDAIALLNSLRRYAPTYPVCFIPYDDHHTRLATILNDRFGVQKYEDAQLFKEIENQVENVLGWPAPMCRVLAMWSGPFDHFLYFDVDVVVFRDQGDIFNLLQGYDFVSCSDGLGILDTVFAPSVIEQQIFSKQQLADIFNTGFYASRKEALGHDQLFDLLRQAQHMPEVFLPYYQDQTILNYLVLKAIPNRTDLRKLKPFVPDISWAGEADLNVVKDKAYLGNGMPLRGLHWASFKNLATRPHVDLWLRYRYPGRLGQFRACYTRLVWFATRIRRRCLHAYASGRSRLRFLLEQITGKASSR